ncbi:MAG: acyltransferase [Actinomycetota bacterium]|nr:acyltransferase [Actinomycetota bacterium]
MSAAAPPVEVSDQQFGGFRLGYRPAFDGVRGLFVLVVLAVHATYLLIPKYAGLYVPGGFIAVDVFFVLSGFLITSLLLQEWDRNQRISMRKFYRRRALRLFPGLWTVMVVQLVYTLFVHDALAYELKGLAAILFYVGNFSWKFGAIIPDAFGQTWSLAIEEQFYLLWPLALIGLIRLRNRRLAIGVMCGLIAVALLCRLVLWNVGVPWNKVYVQTEARFDTLMIGTLFAYLLHTGWRLPRRIGWYGGLGALFLAAITVTAHREDSWMFDGGYTLVALASGFIVLAVLDQHSPMGRIFSIRPLRVLGRLSYSLYIWHVFVFLTVERAWPTRSTLVRLVAGLGITFIASALSYYVIELPFLRRKGSVLGQPTNATPAEVERSSQAAAEPAPADA